MFLWIEMFIQAFFSRWVQLKSSCSFVVCDPGRLTVPLFQGSDEEDVALTAQVVEAFLEVGFDSSVWIPIISGFA